MCLALLTAGPGGAAPSAPLAIVTIAADPGDTRAAAVAAAVAAAIARNLQSRDLMIRVDTSGSVGEASEVRYRFATDAGLAQDLAGFLPGFARAPVLPSPDLNTGPGEIVVTPVLAPVLAPVPGSETGAVSP